MSDSQPTEPKLYGIKEVAQKTGLPASTIRYYDQQFSDYLDVKRGAGRRRMFSPQAVDRLMMVQKMLKEEGLSLRQVRQALSSGQGATATAPVEFTEWQAELDRLKSHVADLERQVDELKEIQRRTLALVDNLAR
jgi:DNA-binding transcriptional MerR regulator